MEINKPPRLTTQELAAIFDNYLSADESIVYADFITLACNNLLPLLRLAKRFNEEAVDMANIEFQHESQKVWRLKKWRDFIVEVNTTIKQVENGL